MSDQIKCECGGCECAATVVEKTAAGNCQCSSACGCGTSCRCSADARCSDACYCA